MIAQTANSIIDQLNKMPNGDRIKRLLFLKLEEEISQTRFGIQQESTEEKENASYEVPESTKE